LNGSTGTFSPSWTTSPSGTCSGFTAAFKASTSTGGITVSVAPTSAGVLTNSTQQFTATVTNDNANAGVTWALSGSGCSGATCGTLSSNSSASGAAITYTAPGTVPSPATVTLTATSVTDHTKSAAATITVTVTPAISVSVSPSSATVNADTNQISFTPTVINDSAGRGVNWMLSGSCSGSACGALSATTTLSGVPVGYTPPASVSSALSVTLTATSVTDSTKFASAAITVNPAVQAFSCANSPCPAFPEAQGGGAASVGGRGGVVYNVNTLSDSTNSGCLPNSTATCSLRDCMSATGARTCVFRVSGLITFLSRAYISNPFITIAGETAPGGGIVIGGPNQAGEQIFIKTHDVVIRYLTWDGNNPNTATGPDTGTVCCAMSGVQGTDEYNIVWDHITTRWAGNKAFPGVSDGVGASVHHTTLQWILMYEPNACHPVGYGTLYVQSGDDLSNTEVDMHHSMFVNVDHRLPLNQSGRNTRIVNTLSFNYGQTAALSMGGIQGDFIGNKYLDGTSDPAQFRDTTAVCCPGQAPGSCAKYGSAH
jgi:hypothetical protein